MFGPTKNIDVINSMNHLKIVNKNNIIKSGIKFDIKLKKQTNYIFVSTNGGILHAIDPEDGSEKFAFMPDQFVKKAYDFVSEPPLQPGNIREPYGLDGSWIAWRRPEINGSGERTGDAANVYT